MDTGHLVWDGRVGTLERHGWTSIGLLTMMTDEWSGHLEVNKNGYLVSNRR